MKLLADENFRRDLVEWLRKTGHDVAWVVEDCPGSLDTEIIDQANRENRILLSSDLDFGELVVMRGYRIPGVLILRLGTIQSEEILQIFMDRWPHIESTLTNHIVVLTPHRIRVRPIHTA